MTARTIYQSSTPRHGLFVTWGGLKKQELSQMEQLFVYGGGCRS